jgi:hypothetical protein
MVCFQAKNPNLGKFYGLLLYFMDIWYSSWQFGIFFPVLVFCTKKNPATLICTCEKPFNLDIHKSDYYVVEFSIMCIFGKMTSNLIVMLTTHKENV